MKVAVIANPISGRGKSLARAKEVMQVLGRRGIETTFQESSPTLEPEAVDRFAAGADLLLLAGGDGTLMHLLPTLSRTGTPVYMLPTARYTLR